MIGANCTLDGDCEGPTVCYNDPPWRPQNFPPAFCSCSNYYGWTGADCSSFSTLIYALLFLHAVGVIICFAGATLSIKVFCELYSTDATHTLVHRALGILSFFALAVGLALELVEILVLVTPELHTSLRNGPDTKVHEYRAVRIILQNVFTSLVVLILLNSPFLWMETTFGSVSKATAAVIWKKLESIELYAILGDALFIITSSAVELSTETFLWSALQLPVFLLWSYLLIVLPGRIAAAVDREKEKGFMLVYERIVLSRRIGVGFAVLFFALALAIGYTFFNHRDYAPVETPAIVLIALGFGLVYCGLIGILIYERKTARTTLEMQV